MKINAKNEREERWGCPFGVLNRRIGTDCFERRVIFDCKGGERERERGISSFSIVLEAASNFE